MMLQVNDTGIYITETGVADISNESSRTHSLNMVALRKKYSHWLQNLNNAFTSFFAKHESLSLSYTV